MRVLDCSKSQILQHPQGVLQTLAASVCLVGIWDLALHDMISFWQSWRTSGKECGLAFFSCTAFKLVAQDALMGAFRTRRGRKRRKSALALFVCTGTCFYSTSSFGLCFDLWPKGKGGNSCWLPKVILELGDSETNVKYEAREQ